MPPVFGPVSPSSLRLASCAGTRGSTVVPSVIANRDTSGPSRYSSTSTAPPPSSTFRPCATAASRSSVTSTPFPAARPSSLTTYGAPTSSSTVSSSAGPPTGQARAVGTPAASITCLAKDLLPSSWAAWAEGPKQAIPASRTASAAPATSGTSGPMTTRSARHAVATAATSTGSAASTARGSATARVPAFPGAQASAWTAGSDDRATHRACSRAPEPITSTRTAGDATEPATHCNGRPSGPAPSVPEQGPPPLRARPVGLRPLGAEPGAQAGPLLGPGTRVDPEQLAARFRLQLAPGGEPRGIQAPVVDGSGHCAAGLAAVTTVAEPAAGRQLGDVGVGGVHPVGVVVERELPHARGVDEESAARQQVQLPRRRRVPAAPVLPDLPGPGHGPPGQCVREAGLPDPRGADHRRGPSRPEQRTDVPEAPPGDRADGQDVDAEGVLPHRRDRGAHVVAEVGLGQDDDRRGPAAPGNGEVALDPAHPGIAGERVHHQDGVEVCRHHLCLRGPPGDGPHEGVAPRQDGDRELPAQCHPIAHRRPARLRPVQRRSRDHPLLALPGQHAEPGPVDPGHARGRAPRREFLPAVGGPAQI